MAKKRPELRGMISPLWVLILRECSTGPKVVSELREKIQGKVTCHDQAIHGAWSRLEKRGLISREEIGKRRYEWSTTAQGHIVLALNSKHLRWVLGLRK